MASASEPRAVSRGRTAGRRKSLRFLNDNFVLSRGYWGPVTYEDEISGRLEHMLISVEHRTAFERLLTEESNEELLSAFRRGEVMTLGETRSTGAVSRRCRTHNVNSLLEEMASRIDRRVRALLLRHSRSEGGCAFLHSCERALYFVARGIVPEPLDISIFDRASQELVLLRPLAWSSSSSEGSHPCCLHVAFSDGFHRLLLEGLAKFYGCEWEEWEEDEGPGESARCVKLWKGDRSDDSRSAVATARRLLQPAVAVPPTNDFCADSADVSGAEATMHRSTDFVPLFLVFARCMQSSRC